MVFRILVTASLFPGNDGFSCFVTGIPDMPVISPPVKTSGYKSTKPTSVG
jgi:hypothetical protein